MITLENILARIPSIVGEPIDKRWRRASLTLRGSDGVSREDFFLGLSTEERLKLVTDKLVSGAPWSPVLQKNIPKTSGKGTRPICWPTCEDAAIIYALVDTLGPAIEEKLSDVAVAYRPGKRMTDSIISAVSRARARRLNVVSVTDIKDFYDSIPWATIDRVVDELPADPAVKALLKGLVRVEVRRVEDGLVVERDRGIPQGLAISPMLANLALASFDTNVAATSGWRGTVVRRYADDILALSPYIEAGRHSMNVVRAQLGMLGLKVKEGTGQVVDLAVEGSSATWLGIRLRGVMSGGSTSVALDIPASTVETKTRDIRAELEAGLTTRSDIESRLGSLGLYWASMVPLHQSRKAIEAIRNEVLHPRGFTSPQVRTHIPGMVPGMNQRKEKTIEQVIHPTYRTPRTHWEEGDGTGTGRMALRAGRAVGIEKRKDVSSYARPSAPRRQRVEHEETREGNADDRSSSSSTPNTHSDGVGLGIREAGPEPVSGDRAGGDHPPRVASAVDTLAGLELQRPDHRISDGREGVPSCPHPLPPKKTIVITAEARGSKNTIVRVNADGVPGLWQKLKVYDASSTAEVVLAGFEMALAKLDPDEVMDVRLVTSDPTICGYVAKGWRVGSFAILKRLRALDKYAVDSGNIQAPASGTGP